MPRSRVLSFMSQWGGQPKSLNFNDNPTSPTKIQLQKSSMPTSTITPSSSTHQLDQYARASPTPRTRADSRPSSRPISMVQTYQPPTMEVAQDTLPELQRIFTYLNSHSNKLYQEGYFLKLHDLDTRGRPSPERVWTECFAQLVGTVLSLWDAASLDAAGEDGEVVPTFINLADASIKMIESLPMNSQDGQVLQNVLSLSTAASNRYLLHFNSLHSLTQWTAGIRLSIYENATLQEAYTGSLIAGKGKTLNSIRTILERTRFKYEDWARVRFGAGTPWRRCWFVVSPPDEKEYQKLQKSSKRRTIYGRSAPVLKGDIKFYESKRINKKTVPIATIKDAYSAYAIYPQAKPLVDQSTLVKIEGQIVIHSSPETATEGFVFVMPEAHPAVTGFEILLRFLFPVFDTFCLYGRPTRLVADVLDTRSLMFAMPHDRRQGYLDVLDVAGLIHTEGSQNWTEREWRKQMKDLTSKRMSSWSSRPGPRDSHGRTQRIGHRSSLPSRTSTLRFGDAGSLSSPSTRRPSPTRPDDQRGPHPPELSHLPGPQNSLSRHQRSISEANGLNHYQEGPQPRLSYEDGVEDDISSPPRPPPHAAAFNDRDSASGGSANGYETGREELSPTIEHTEQQSMDRHVSEEEQMRIRSPPLNPVATPPAFMHAPSEKPLSQPYQATELRRANSQVDEATLNQLADASNRPLPDSVAAAGASAAWRASPDGMRAAANMAERNRPSEARGMTNGNSSQHQSYRYMPTIPASPYVEPSGFIDPATQSTGPPVPAHGQVEPRSSSEAQMHPGSDGFMANMNRSDQPTSPSGVQSPHRFSIQRKPVPNSELITSPGSAEPPRSPSPSLDSLRDHYVDQDALDQIGTRTSIDRTSTTSGSHYEDESATPDYASTKSSGTKHSVEKPRAGVLRTVGQVDMEPIAEGSNRNSQSLDKASAIDQSDMPTIDFGPTLAYRPDTKRRPGTSGTITQPGFDESRESKERSNETDTEAGRLDNSNERFFSGGVSPGVSTHRRAHSTSPHTSGSVLKDEHRRSLAWHPGMTTVGTPSPGRESVDPQEWVQQRAVAASYSQLANRPSNSRSNSNAPHPLSRNSSGDWSQQSQQRPPSRPLSRGASQMLNPTQGLIHGDYSQHLSAREQEHVARATGTPFFQMSSNDQGKRSPESGGLVGAISAREREKENIKEGRRSVMVQQAIAANLARQQQQTHQYLPQAQSQAYGPAPGQVQQFHYPSQSYAGQQVANGSPTYAATVNQQGYFVQPGTGIPHSANSSPGAQAYGYPLQQHLPQRQMTQPYGASFLRAQQAQLNQAQLQHRRSGQF